MTENEAENDLKIRPRRLKQVNLEKIHRKFLVVLEREVHSLMDESYSKKLCEESSESLIKYMKLLRELRDMEMESLEGLTDEQLEEIAKNSE